MFILSLNYIKSMDEVETYLQDHREFLDRFYREGKFLFSGPKEPRTGGVIICISDSKDDVYQIISEDPFYINAIAEYEVTEFHPVKSSTDLKKYLQ